MRISYIFAVKQIWPGFPLQISVAPTLIGENFEIYLSQMAKLFTMVGESFEIYLFQKIPWVFPEFSQNWKGLPVIGIQPGYV